MVGKIVRIKGDVNTKYVKIKEIVEEGYVGYGFSITNDAIGFMCNLISEVLTIDISFNSYNFSYHILLFL